MKLTLTCWLLLLLFILPIDALHAQEATTYIVSSNQTINARNCPQLDCAVVTTLPSGTVVTVIGTTQGATVSGSSLWYEAQYNGEVVYIHSSLLSPQIIITPTPTSPSNQADWVEYNHMGYRISVPANWQIYSGDEDFIDYMFSAVRLTNPIDETQERFVRAGFSESFIAADATLQALVIAHADYNGRLVDERAIQNFCINLNNHSTGQSCEVIELPAGTALHTYTNIGANAHTYTFYQDRTEYSIAIIAANNLSEWANLHRDVATSFSIYSTRTERTYSALPGGNIQSEDNFGELEPGKFAAWTFDAQPSQVVTIGTLATDPRNTNLDMYLVVRDPQGNVIAESDSSGAFGVNHNPVILNLELSKRGTYTVEVHAYPGYVSGAYTLRLIRGFHRENEI